MIFDRAYPDFLPRGTHHVHVCGFVKESRMKFANATNINRKSGGAKWTCCAPVPGHSI
jgi:hypothetical protein